MQKGPKKLKTHVNLDALVGVLLDAVAAKRGEDPLYPTPSQSDLPKAARLFPEQCETRPELRATIDLIVDTRTKAAPGTKIIPYRPSKPLALRNRSKAPQRLAACG